MGFLRRLMGPDVDEIWGGLAREIGAEHEPGGFWTGGGAIRSHVGEWTVTLDTYMVSTGKSSTIFTRMRAPFVNQDNFRFAVSRTNFFTPVAKFFGAQDIEIGDPEFDEEFVIKGTDAERVAHLFADPELKRLLRAQPSLAFSVLDDEGWFAGKYPEGVDALSFQVHGVITDVDRLKKLFDLFALTLDRLCEMGSAYEGDPGFEVKR